MSVIKIEKSSLIKTSEVMSDINMSLGKFKTLVDKWVEIYGEDSVIKTDAGVNNVDIKIIYK